MTRTALIVLEILIGVAALGGEAYLIMTSRQALTEGPGLTLAKTRVIVDLVVLDAIVVVMFLAAWQVVTNGSGARWLSIIAGAIAAGSASSRPTLTGSRLALSSVVTILGLVVVLLAVLIPSPG